MQMQQPPSQQQQPNFYPNTLYNVTGTTPFIPAPSVVSPATSVNTLYYNATFANSLAPLMLTVLNNLPVRTQAIDLEKGQHKEEWFAKMNPCHSVPAYQAANGFALWEANAIMKFLTNAFPQLQQFYPSDPHVRGKIDTAMDWRQTTLYPHAAKLTDHVLGFSDIITEHPSAIEALEEDFKTLKYFLGEFPYIGGMHPCLADFSILSAIKLIDCRTDIKIDDDILSYIGRIEHLLPPRQYQFVWGKFDELCKRKRAASETL